MAKNYFKSYIWLLETLQSHGALTLKEIKSLWQKSAVNEEGKDLPARTFANHVAAIADIFGIDIVCNRSENTYYIENLDDIGGSSIREWMLDILPDEFTLPPKFSATDYFKGIYGVRIYPDMKKEFVKLKVYGYQVRYSKSTNEGDFFV